MLAYEMNIVSFFELDIFLTIDNVLEFKLNTNSSDFLQ